MKNTIACIVSLACASTSLAITPGGSAAVTLALTASSESGGFKVVNNGETTYEYEKTTSKTDSAGNTVSDTIERKSVINTTRYGNADMLADLNQRDLLDGSISGWSIIVVSSANSSDNSGPTVYAVKKGKAPVQIELTLKPIAYASAENGKYIADYVKQTESISYSSSSKATVTLDVGDFKGQGTLTGNDKWVTGSLGKGATAVTYGFSLPGAVKLSAYSGTCLDSYIAEGTLTVAAAKVVDLETLGFAPAAN